MIIFWNSDISKDKWEKMTAANGWNSVELRDNRYNQIVHMVSAANGAEDFYSTEVSVSFSFFVWFLLWFRHWLTLKRLIIIYYLTEIYVFNRNMHADLKALKWLVN